MILLYHAFTENSISVLPRCSFALPTYNFTFNYSSFDISFLSSAIHASIALISAYCCRKTVLPVSGIFSSFSLAAIFSSIVVIKDFTLFSMFPMYCALKSSETLSRLTITALKSRNMFTSTQNIYIIHCTCSIPHNLSSVIPRTSITKPSFLLPILFFLGR